MEEAEYLLAALEERQGSNMENRIVVYHRLYVLCMAGMLPGLLLSIFLYIRLDMYEVFGYFRRKMVCR